MIMGLVSFPQPYTCNYALIRKWKKSWLSTFSLFSRRDNNLKNSTFLANKTVVPALAHRNRVGNGWLVCECACVPACVQLL